MALQFYKAIRFTRDVRELIETMNAIVAEYQAEGYTLTVRQLYYQLVSRNVVENTEKSYKRVTGIANDARMAGVMDWDAIEDRGRSFRRRARWASGGEILKAVAQQYHQDLWADQNSRVCCIIEKEALLGVCQPVCNTYDVPILAAKGYPSSTVLREFVLSDILPHARTHETVVLHLGDHDPSGIDMTRDLNERLELFAGGPVALVRIALTMKQIQERKPPPNPAKVTDSRFENYQRAFGNESWELDALPPTYLAKLIERTIRKYIEFPAWEATQAEIERVKGKLLTMSRKFK